MAFFELEFDALRDLMRLDEDIVGVRVKAGGEDIVVETGDGDPTTYRIVTSG